MRHVAALCLSLVFGSLATTAATLRPVDNQVGSFPGEGKGEGCSSTEYVPVLIVAYDFTDKNKRLAHHQVQELATGFTIGLDSDGRANISFPVGCNLTFVALPSNGYHQTQSSVVTVPPGGLTSDSNCVALQVPTDFIYDLFNLVTPGKKNNSDCQVVVTACNVGVTWSRGFPQGLLGTKVTLSPALESKTFFFGTWGNLSNKTDPLPNNRTSSSWDGGVLFESVPVMSTTTYTVHASHPGFTFSETYFQCTTPGTFINAGPNLGPRASPLSIS